MSILEGDVEEYHPEWQFGGVKASQGASFILLQEFKLKGGSDRIGCAAAQLALVIYRWTKFSQVSFCRKFFYHST